MKEIMPKLTLEYPNGYKITALCVEVNAENNGIVRVGSGERVDIELSVVDIQKTLPEKESVE